MNLRFLLALSLSSFVAYAQDTLCNAARASNVDKASGVIVQNVTLSGNWGSNSATVFLPDREIADGAVLISHSMIRSTNGASADLTPLALTLAGAGAAVIVPDRTMIWPPKDEWTNREGAAAICAAHWLIENVKVRNDGKELTTKDNIVVRWGYGYVGPTVCDPDDTRECHRASPFVWRSRHNAAKVDATYVPMGDEGGGYVSAALQNGGLEAARWLSQRLGLSPIQRIVGDPHAVTRADIH